MSAGDVEQTVLHAAAPKHCHRRRSSCLVTQPPRETRATPPLSPLRLLGFSPRNPCSHQTVPSSSSGVYFPQRNTQIERQRCSTSHPAPSTPPAHRCPVNAVVRAQHRCRQRQRPLAPTPCSPTCRTTRTAQSAHLQTGILRRHQRPRLTLFFALLPFPLHRPAMHPAPCSLTLSRSLSLYARHHRFPPQHRLEIIPEINSAPAAWPAAPQCDQLGRASPP